METGTSFAYDGQMGIEDVDSGSAAAVTDYAIGARSIERIAKTSGGTTNVCYPIFDGHGNMVSTLTYSGSSFSLSNQRDFDAWGNIRGGSANGDPKGRYCASLGHKQDDESSLIYMRARYYDGVAGRFVSEDPGGTGHNLFLYTENNPLGSHDRSGNDPTALEQLLDDLTALLGGAEKVATAKQFRAFLGIIVGCAIAINRCIALCEVGAEADESEGNFYMAAETAAAYMTFFTFAVAYMVDNLTWFIELNSDPNATPPMGINWAGG